MAFEIKKRTVRGPLKNGKPTTASRYDVRYRDPAGKVRTKTFHNKKEAEAFQSTNRADVIRGDWTDPNHGKITFSDWWERYWTTTVNLRPSSRARDESYYRNHLLPTFGAMQLAAIDHTAVVAWIAELSASGLAPATVVKAAQIMGKAMGSAVDAGMIRTDPTARVKLPKVEHHEMLFLSPNEVSTLTAAMDKRYQALVLVGAYCGLRFGEIVGLKRDRVNLLHKRIEVLEIVTEVKGTHYTGPPKTRAGRRSVPMPKVVADALTEHLKTYDDEFVFAAPQGGPLRASLFRRRFWQPACVAAGVGEMVPTDPDDEDSRKRYVGLRLHDLRHTAVALWIAAGASPNEVAARAGHSSVVTVLDRYGHLLPGHEDKVNDALDLMATGATATPTAAVRAIDAR
jgi:integrase